MTDKSNSRFYKIINYGCQMNISDSERMAGQLTEMGYTETTELGQADVILINTCCVRESAEDKIHGKIGEIKHLKQSKPHLVFGVTGCMAQKDGDALLKRAPHVDFVLGTNKVHELGNVIREVQASNGHIVDLSAGDAPLPEDMKVARGGKLSAWVPIMYGCNNFCTYCIVPYVRGRERSRELAEVVREVEEVAAKGFKEVTLLGQNVNSYGKDTNGSDFADLLAAVDKVKGIERVRYMTSHPRDLSDKAIEVIRNSAHICKHFHLPVQYGSDKLLKAMNRGYTTDYYRELVKKIRTAVPDASITTDLIVGFPGETAADFQQMLDFLREIRYDAAYTFLYSKRSGTPAAEMEDQVPQEVKKARLQELMDLQNSISLEINEGLKGQNLEVLVEGPSRTDANVWSGRTSTNKIVLWEKSGSEQAGDLVQVEITQPQTWVLKGRLANI